jgi:UDP-glucose 4-epimerase
VIELYEEIQRATGVEREAEHAPPRLGELQRSVLDPAAARRELGWRPQRSLADGLRATWSWVQQE